MKIIYLVLAHQNPSQVKRMIEKLVDKNSFFILHIDKKSDYSVFSKTLRTLCNTTLIPQEKSINVSWGDISMVQATLLLLREALNLFDVNNEGYCILLSGQDYPIKNKSHIYKYFSENYGMNYMNYFPLPCMNWNERGLDRIEAYNHHIENRNIFSYYPVMDKRFYAMHQFKNLIKYIIKNKNINRLSKLFAKKRIFPSYLKPYGGSQWWALPFDTIQKILFFLDTHSDYLEYNMFTKNSDEIFFQSIVLSVVDKSFIQDNVTFTDWERGNGGSPRTFTCDDFDILKESEKLFARKFDMTKDNKIFDKVDMELLQMKER